MTHFGKSTSVSIFAESCKAKKHDRIMKDLGRICLKLKNRMTCNQLQVIRFLSMHDNFHGSKHPKKELFSASFGSFLKAIIVSRETF